MAIIAFFKPHYRKIALCKEIRPLFFNFDKQIIKPPPQLLAERTGETQFGNKNKNLCIVFISINTKLILHCNAGIIPFGIHLRLHNMGASR